MTSLAGDAEWLQAFEVMQKRYNFTDDAIGVFAINLRFDLDDIETIASEAMTGGGDDKKCDLVYVDKERSIAVVAQCYLSRKAKDAAPANKASDLNTAIGWLLNANIDALPDGLQGKADELRSAVSAGEIKQFYVWFVHNLPPSTNVKNELKTVEATAKTAIAKHALGHDVNIFAEEICNDRLASLYRQAERTIIVTNEFETHVADAVEIKEQDWESLLTVVKGTWIRKLYNTYKTDLFSANLRGYLGSRESESNINNGIKHTAADEPGNFFIYNNGITALVLGYELGPKSKTGRKLKITGISIVNGAQTTGSLSNTEGKLSPEVLVPVRFIIAKNEALVSNVVRYNNSQNRLQAADFRSTDQIQERLRQEFHSVPDAEYEGGRRGGASDAIKRSKFTLPSYTVGQSLAAFHGDPVTAYDKKSEIWTSEKNYRNVFTDRTSAKHIVFCYSLLSAINGRKTDLIAKQKVDSASLTNVESIILAFLQKKGANYLLIYAASQCIETILSRSIPNKFDLKFAKNLSPADAKSLWMPLIDIMLPISGNLDGCFSRNRINNDGMRKTMPTFTGIFASIRPLHDEWCNSFKKAVQLG